MGVTVEADEVYLGAPAGKKKNRRPVKKMAVMTLIERDGAARSFHIPTVRAERSAKA